MSYFLLVPANVQAFLIGKAGAEPVYNPASVPRSESELARWYVGNSVFSFDNPAYQEEPLASGVHLHWALPAALTRSLQKGKNEPALQPCIPNRWLVVRMLHTQGNPAISSKAWVVESDYLATRPGSAATPFPFVGSDLPTELARKHSGYAGRSISAKGWKETHPAYRFELKSFGWGDPSFAAFYPACKGVLGFHDKLEGVAKGQLLTYMVMGWYSDPERDPLHLPPVPPDTIETCNARRASLGWRRLGPEDVTTLPPRTLCHGSVVGITWQGSDVRYAASKAASKAEIAIGGSAAEALAALLNPGDTEKSIQQVLCAFQHGQATQVTELDELGDLLHRHGFAAVPGGARWIVEPAATPLGSKASPPPISDKVHALIADLNEAQRALDKQAREIESMRSRLFSCWATWAGKQEGPRRPDRKVVEPAADALRQAADALGPLRAKVEACKRAAAAQLTAELKLTESTMPPFLQPKDPFVVVKGEDLMGVDRVHVDHPLPSRLMNEVVTGVHLIAGVRKTISAADCFQLIDFPDVAELGSIPLSLALETLLFDPTCADLVPSGASGVFRTLQESLDRSHESGGNKLEWHGQPPDLLAVTRYAAANPWLPVYLMWQAHWVPAYDPGTGHSKALKDRWKFDSGSAAQSSGRPFERLVGDLIPASPLPAKPVIEGLHGVTLISSLSGKQLAENLKEFTGKSITSIEETAVLGQSLGGFNDLLVRQALGLFLPPFDPASEKLDDDIWNALGQAPQPVMPVPGTFLPVRTGALKLVNLWIVDSFGQTRKPIDLSDTLHPPEIIASAVLPRQPSGYHAAFSPRLVQPTRLNFDWQPADDKMPGPVCGWVVANYMEKSLAIFSAEGEPLGTLETVLPSFGLKTIDSKVTFQRRPIPGSTLAIQQIANERLRRFIDLVAAFTADEGQAFLELVDLVLRRSDERLPAEDPAMAVLLGRPLALVHASLGLEVEGLPAGYWNTNGEDWNFTTEGFEQLPVPVRLGGMSLSADGLVGYMPEGRPCFVASDGAEPRMTSTNLLYEQDLKVAGGDARPVSLTLLMDASARVHASTGMLPRLSVALPREAAHQAGSIAEVYIGIAPVLAGRVSAVGLEITMPRPSDAFGQWSWATRPDLTSQSWSPIHPADDRARFADDLALTEGWLRLRLDRGAAPPGDNN